MDKASKKKVGLQLNAGLNRLMSKSESSLICALEDSRATTTYSTVNGNSHHKQPKALPLIPSPVLRPLTPNSPRLLVNQHETGRPFIIPTVNALTAMQSKSPLLPKFSLDSRKEEIHAQRQPKITIQPTEVETKVHCAGPTKWRPDLSLKIDVLAIVWFHPDLNRHQAEAELINAEEGVYLLRPRMKDGVSEGFSLDVRSSHSVKHFIVSVDNGDLVLGKEHFSDLDSLEEHFDNNPMLGDNNEHSVVCRYPYPREVEDIHEYYTLSSHFVPTPSRRKRIENMSKPHSYSLVSKEGFLVKEGGRVRTWKRRWFVLRDTFLHYYASEKDTKPIKSISLRDAMQVSECDIPGRLNTFQLILPTRTFYMQAPSATNMDDWVSIIHFKLNEEVKANRLKKENASTTW